MPGRPASGARARGVPQAAVVAVAGGTALADRRGLGPLIQSRCLTNPRLVPRHRRNAGWIERLQVPRGATHVIFSTACVLG